jgi:DNA-binding transcriptional ArsR family regulator
MVNGQHVSDSRALIDLLCAAAESESWIPEEKMPASTDPLGPARQLRRLSGVREGAQVLIDDPTREQALGLFGQFRDELWQIPPTFVVAVRPDVADSLSSPPADVFFDDLARLEPFTGRPAEELIRRRLGHTTSPIAIPLDASLEPRALVALAYGEKRPVDLMPARQDLLLAGAEAAAGRAGAMLLAEMWDRGGVSASDRDLQRRLGVTRNRLTELLRALEDGGILHSHPERREGKTGRPRMIYEVASGER